MKKLGYIPAILFFAFGVLISAISWTPGAGSYDGYDPYAFDYIFSLEEVKASPLKIVGFAKPGQKVYIFPKNTQVFKHGEELIIRFKK